MIYYWSLRQGGKQVPNLELGQTRTITTPKLKPGNYAAFVRAQGKGDKVSDPAARNFTVPKPGTKAKPKPPDNSLANDCLGTWEINLGPTSPDDAVVPGGVPSIQTATTPEQAKAALLDWLKAIEPNPHKLVVAVRSDLKLADVNEGSLVDGMCASQTAYGYEVQLLDLYNDPASSVTPGEVPSDGTATGYDGQQVFQYPHRGVKGDRKGIHVHLKNGVDYWITWRNGSWVFIGADQVPSQLPTEGGTVEAAATTPTQTPGHPASSSSSQTGSSSGSSSATSSRQGTTEDPAQASVVSTTPGSDEQSNPHSDTSGSRPSGYSSPASPTDQSVPSGQSAPVSDPVAAATTAASSVGSSDQGPGAPTGP